MRSTRPSRLPATLVVAGTEPELDHLAGGVAGDEVGRGVLGGEAAPVHDGQAVAELFGLVHVVGGDDQGDALRA